METIGKTEAESTLLLASCVPLATARKACSGLLGTVARCLLIEQGKVHIAHIPDPRSPKHENPKILHPEALNTSVSALHATGVGCIYS